jgi:hypothetical protein
MNKKQLLKHQHKSELLRAASVTQCSCLVPHTCHHHNLLGLASLDKVSNAMQVKAGQQRLHMDKKATGNAVMY